MSPAVEITGTQLTNALRALGVNFIMGGQSTNETLHKQPARLTAALAESTESRLDASLLACRGTWSNLGKHHHAGLLWKRFAPYDLYR